MARYRFCKDAHNPEVYGLAHIGVFLSLEHQEQLVNLNGGPAVLTQLVQCGTLEEMSDEDAEAILGPRPAAPAPAISAGGGKGKGK